MEREQDQKSDVVRRLTCWVLACALGLAMSEVSTALTASELAGFYLKEPMLRAIRTFWIFGLGGAIIGTAQAVVVRAYGGPVITWILATAIGLGSAATLVHDLLPEAFAGNTILWFGLVAGVLVGGLQAWFTRSFITEPLLWAAFTSVGWAVGYPLGNIGGTTISALASGSGNQPALFQVVLTACMMAGIMAVLIGPISGIPLSFLSRPEQRRGGVRVVPRDLALLGALLGFSILYLAIAPRLKVASLKSDALPGDRTLLAGAEPITCAGFRPDGLRVASGFRDGTVRIWNTETGEKLADLKCPTPGTTSVRYSSGGDRLLAWSTKRASLWDPDSGRKVLELPVDQFSDELPLFDPQGNRILGGKPVALWDSQTGERLSTIGARVEGARFFPDGRRLLLRGVVPVGSSTCFGPQVLDTVTGETILKIRGYGGSILTATIDPPGRRIVTASAGGEAIVWSAETGEQLAAMRMGGLDPHLTFAVFSPEGDRVLTVNNRSHEAEIRFWDASTGGKITSISIPSFMWTTGDRAEFSPDGRLLLCYTDDVGPGTRNNRAWIRNPATGDVLSSIAPVRQSSDLVGFDPGSELVLVLGDPPLIFDARTGQLRCELQSRGQTVTSGFFSPDGRRLMTVSADAVRIWDLAARRASP